MNNNLLTSRDVLELGLSTMSNSSNNDLELSFLQSNSSSDESISTLKETIDIETIGVKPSRLYVNNNNIKLNTNSDDLKASNLFTYVDLSSPDIKKSNSLTIKIPQDLENSSSDENNETIIIKENKKEENNYEFIKNILISSLIGALIGGTISYYIFFSNSFSTSSLTE
jgi:hypothetical protein